MTEGPHRRHDDTVSFRDMVEYVSEHDTLMHTVRAESLLHIGRSLEKMEKGLEDHEAWHRDYLEKLISQGSQTRLGVMSLVIASLLSTAAIVVSLFTVLHH